MAIMDPGVHYICFEASKGSANVEMTLKIDRAPASMAAKPKHSVVAPSETDAVANDVLKIAFEILQESAGRVEDIIAD